MACKGHKMQYNTNFLLAILQMVFVWEIKSLQFTTTHIPKHKHKLPSEKYEDEYKIQKQKIQQS